MVPEYHPFVRRDEVAAVFQAFGGGGPHGIESQDLGRDELAVEPIAESIATSRGNYQPHGIDLLTPVQGDGSHGQHAHEGNRDPYRDTKSFWHLALYQ